MTLAAWSVSWSSPPVIILNVLVIAIWLVALGDLVRTPRARWYNPSGKVLQIIIVVVVGAQIRGVFIPIGALIWIVRRRRGWLGLRSLAT